MKIYIPITVALYKFCFSSGMEKKEKNYPKIFQIKGKWVNTFPLNESPNFFYNFYINLVPIKMLNEQQ